LRNVVVFLGQIILALSSTLPARSQIIEGWNPLPAARSDKPITETFCIFRGQSYSIGALFCIAKDRALRCDEKSVGYETTHWTLLNPDMMSGKSPSVDLLGACTGNILAQ
jgi:hypothetical protein